MLLLYRIFFPVFTFLIRTLTLPGSKLQRHLKVRSLFNEKFSFQNPVWLHASSVGEYEQAREIILALKEQYPGVQVICSIFSASGWEQRKNDGAADYFFPLPFDHYFKMKALLEKIQPSCILYARYDLWPNLVHLATKRNIPQMLFCASNPPGSKRFQPPFGSFQKVIHKQLQCIATIDEEENLFFQSWFHNDVNAFGDTRYDAIQHRLSKHDKAFLDSIQSILPRGKKVLIAGSCYKTSIQFLIDFVSANEHYFLILVPHHPSKELTSYSVEHCGQKNIDCSILSSNPGSATNCLMVDQVGRLLQLYRLADYAYVGGGWEGSIHTLIEPIALGVPTFCGPHIHVSKEAIQLKESKIVQVMNESTSGEVELCLQDINENYEEIQQAGNLFFKEKTGATKSILKYLGDNGWFTNNS